MAGEENLLDLTLDTYADRADEKIRKYSDQYFVNKRFGIGCEVDSDKLRHYQMLNRILCTDETQLIDWVDSKIKGEPMSKKCCKSIKNDCYNNIDSCEVNGCFKWEKVEW